MKLGLPVLKARQGESNSEIAAAIYRAGQGRTAHGEAITSHFNHALRLEAPWAHRPPTLGDKRSFDMAMHFRLMILTAACGVAASCSSLSCGADQRKLAALERGMPYEEVSRIMGCSGRLVSEHGLNSDEYVTIEWDGPDSLLFARTHVVFFHRVLHSYTTDKRGGF